MVVMNVTETGTKERILHSAYRLFYREGYSRVSVDAIADRACVTKRTVYYHFKSKDDIVAEVLENQHAYLLRQFQSWAGPDSADAVQMIENLFKQLKRWADGPGWLGSGFTRITTELADMPGHPARHAASSHKARVEQWLADQFEHHEMADPSGLAQQLMILIEGSMSLALIHGDTNYICSATAAAKRLVADQTDNNISLD